MPATPSQILGSVALSSLFRGFPAIATAQGGGDGGSTGGPFTIEEVVMIGSRLPRQTYKLGNVVTTLDEQEIQSIGLQYGADLLRFEPAIAASRNGAGPDRVRAALPDLA